MVEVPSDKNLRKIKRYSLNKRGDPSKKKGKFSFYKHFQTEVGVAQVFVQKTQEGRGEAKVDVECMLSAKIVSKQHAISEDDKYSAHSLKNLKPPKISVLLRILRDNAQHFDYNMPICVQRLHRIFVLKEFMEDK